MGVITLFRPNGKLCRTLYRGSVFLLIDEYVSFGLILFFVTKICNLYMPCLIFSFSGYCFVYVTGKFVCCHML